MIDGRTQLIAHIGYPTEPFKSPMIYNPFFAARRINAVVVPMGCKAEDYPTFLKLVFKLSNVCGALITMPHKVTTLALVEEASVSAKIAGACNAVKIDESGRLIGDMFDGEGFTRGIARKGFQIAGARCLVNGSGGVGSAIAASLAANGAGVFVVADMNAAAAEALAARIVQHYPRVEARAGVADPAGYDLIVNATPLGMEIGDALPFDVARIAPSTFVGEVVMKQEITPLLHAAREKGCRYQVGTDMLFEMIPAYLEFFGFGTATPDELRAVAKVAY